MTPCHLSTKALKGRLVGICKEAKANLYKELCNQFSRILNPFSWIGNFFPRFTQLVLSDCNSIPRFTQPRFTQFFPSDCILNKLCKSRERISNRLEQIPNPRERIAQFFILIYFCIFQIPCHFKASVLI